MKEIYQGWAVSRQVIMGQLVECYKKFVIENNDREGFHKAKAQILAGLGPHDLVGLRYISGSKEEFERLAKLILNVGEVLGWLGAEKLEFMVHAALPGRAAALESFSVISPQVASLLDLALRHHQPYGNQYEGNWDNWQDENDVLHEFYEEEIVTYNFRVRLRVSQSYIYKMHAIEELRRWLIATGQEAYLSRLGLNDDWEPIL